MATAAGTGNNPAPPNKTTKAKPLDPERVRIIKQHRGMQSAMGGMGRNVQVMRFSADKSKKDENAQFSEKIPTNLRPIKLRQMDPEQEWVFMKRVLYLTIIEDPMLGFTPIHLVAEDANGEAIMVFVHEVPHTQKMCSMLCYGQQLAIMNPYMRIALDGNHGIRVDDPETIMLLGKKKDMCRYCRKQDAPHKCGRCKRPYCSRECQVADWNDLDHKRICQKSYEIDYK